VEDGWNMSPKLELGPMLKEIFKMDEYVHG
jgi:hypothetical protein